MIHVVGKYPTAFAEAIRMAIVGFHFRKVAESLTMEAGISEKVRGIGVRGAAASIGLATPGEAISIALKTNQ